MADEQSGRRFEVRSSGDEFELYDPENDDAWIRSDVTEKIPWMT